MKSGRLRNYSCVDLSFNLICHEEVEVKMLNVKEVSDLNFISDYLTIDHINR